MAASVVASDAGTGVFPRIRLLGGSEVLTSGGALTTSADLALVFAFALGRGLRPGDGSLVLSHDFAFVAVFAFAFGLPLTGSIEDPGRPSPGGSSGSHAVAGRSLANRPLTSLYRSRPRS